MTWLPPTSSAAVEQPQAGEEGGYLASVSDLMIGLLFIFILLVVVLAAAQREQQIQIEQEREAARAAGNPRGLVTSELGAAIKRVIPNVDVDPTSGIISLPETALFARGSAQLNPAGKVALERMGAQLERSLPCFAASSRRNAACADNPAGHEIETIFIEGHTDSVPMRRADGYDNFNLSLDRARAVHSVLASSAVLSGLRNELRQPIFSFSAYADTRPRKGSDPMDAVNRRVDLRVVLTYRDAGTTPAADR